MEISRCLSCDGYGWVSDPDEGEQDCDWCRGVGYVCVEPQGLHRPIPTDALTALAEQLEALEAQRLRDLGYTGQAKKPWEQMIRQKMGKLLNGDT
jgi:hypothetical protein